MQTRQYEDVKQHCTFALEHDANNAKAYYRRAVFHRIKDDFESAKKDIKTALALAPNDFEVPTLFIVCITVLLSLPSFHVPPPPISSLFVQ